MLRALNNTLAAFGTLIFASALAQELGLTTAILDAATQAFGRDARARMLHWQHVVDANQHSTELAKLEAANQLINENRFVSDQSLWAEADYWATPIELIGARAGDCEDFTLRATQIEETKLRVIYVNAVNLDQAHMVLGYYPSPGAEPLVLDNLVQAIKPASMRQDLEPVYTFVGRRIWDAKMRSFAPAPPVPFTDVFMARLRAGAFAAMRAPRLPQST